jgi:multidrug efflux pump subunit AcrA (membrane-fusion protein)
MDMSLPPVKSWAPPGATPTAEVGAAARPSQVNAVLVLQSRALQHERFAPAAAAVLSELALTLGCERASIGFHSQGRLRVAATSAGSEPLQQPTLVRAVAAAMHEALDQRAPVVYPLPAGALPMPCFAHAELTRINGGVTVCSVPIVGAERVTGVLLLERRDGFEAATLETAMDVALFVGPLLEMKHRLEAPVGGRLIEAVAPRGVRHASDVRPTWRWGVAAALSVLCATVALWPVTFDVVAPARVEGREQRVIAAPADGFIASVLVRPGETVKAGQLLASLEDRDLALQRDKSAAEIGQLDKQYREALTQDDAAQIMIARAAVEQSRAQLALAESQLERSRLRAPIDGVLIGGDLSQSVGMPVQRGQSLMTVAPVLGQVDEQDVTDLKLDQHARVLFSAGAEQPVPFSIERISPVALTLEGRNIFEAEGRIDDATAGGLRPGQRGIARIDIDRQLNVQVWWHRATQWLRHTAWQLIG